MSYFAQVENGIVINVIVADQEFIDSGVVGTNWIETSADGSFRAHYAGIDFIYDSIDDVFYPPAPYASWILNKTTYTWESPIPYPTDGKFYVWKEDILNWLEVKGKQISTGTQTL
jgi:hypothetical protein